MTTTLSGPAETVAAARELLAQRGYCVLSEPTNTGLALADGEALLSVDGGHSDVATVVAALGWRHRATTERLGFDMPAVAISARGQG